MRKLTGLFLILAFILCAQPALPDTGDQPQIAYLSSTEVGSTGGTTTYFTVPGNDVGGNYNAVEILVVAYRSTGTTGTLVVTLQSSLDNFSASGSTNTVKTMPTLTFTADSTKQYQVAAVQRLYGASPLMFGRQMRVKVDTAATVSATSTIVVKAYFYLHRA